MYNEAISKGLDGELSDRSAFINGLHELADWLAAHPDVPVDSWGLTSLDVAVFGKTKADVLIVAQADGPSEKRYFRNYFELSRSFSGGVKYSINTNREEVCEAVVVGKETVEVPDPDAPRISVERDIVEWKCHPLLGGTA